ncbi:MAG: hypothetical protein J3K34DRAFT_240249 [Monoraphidium minutum]|nr:MAG: hypothetical protein J3K34DRAFT_240249 [Monoraphidium minutum]
MEARGLALEKAPFTLSDEGDWPGGMIQRFRALRQVVEPILEGYDASFLGMLEAPSDGLGVWQAKGLVVAGIAANATFPAFAKLLDGGYGAGPTREGTALVVVSEWTRGDDVGQPWQRDLKARARELIDDGGWAPLYSARMLRTSKGAAFGCMTAGWGEPWRVYGASGEDSSTIDDAVLLEAWSPPPRPDVIAALNAAAEARRARDRGAGGGGKGWRLW